MMMRRRCSGTLTLMALLILPPVAASQDRLLSNRELYEHAVRAEQGTRWADLYAYLMAYVQRGPPELSDGPHLTSVMNALQRARTLALRPGQGNTSGDPAGLDARGDDVAIGVLPPLPPVPASSPLRCEGGGDMRLVYSERDGTAEVRIFFTRAPLPASESYPGSGRCAWIDRPLRRQEPARLSWQLPRSQTRVESLTIGSAQWSSAQGLPILKDQTAALLRGIYGSDLEHLVNAVRYGRMFQVRAYDDGRGALVVSEVDFIR